MNSAKQLAGSAVALNVFIVLGFVIPYVALVTFVAQHGLNFALLVEQVFATPGSTFFALDVIVAALFAIYLALADKRVRHVRVGLVLAAALVGPSFALPLYVKVRLRAEREE